MSNFFSFAWDGKDKFLYADYKIRKELIKNKSDDDPDSFKWLMTYFCIKQSKQKKWSFCNFDPITKKFDILVKIDNHNYQIAENWVKNINFKYIVPELIIKNIIDPLNNCIKPLPNEYIILLKEWSNIDRFAYISSYNYIMKYVGKYIYNYINDCIWSYCGNHIMNAICFSVPPCMMNSYLYNSMVNSLVVYGASFFDIKYNFDFSPLLKLYNAGFVPSFDGVKWRLHSGLEGTIIFEINKNKLYNIE